MVKQLFAKNTAIIIPVYNEAAVIKGVVEAALEHFKYVICIDDGSRDRSREEILKTKALLVVHPINMGQGAALQTGIEFARLIPDVEYFVTYDADGQHRLTDVMAMLEKLESTNVDIVLGSRFLGAAQNISPAKRMLLKAAVLYTNLTVGLKLTDTHNGLRVFSRKAAEKIDITMPDMAHASEILSIIKEKQLKYVEVPVTIEYSDYSKAKGQSFFNSVNIVFDMLLRGHR